MGTGRLGLDSVILRGGMRPLSLNCLHVSGRGWPFLDYAAVVLNPSM